MFFEKTTLRNGVRVLWEHVPGMRSASLGVWFKNGSRCETPCENGISHFLEHMMFKGTRDRTASQLAMMMDELGGQFNAFTTKDCTSFYFRALDTHLSGAIDVLCDMLLNSAFGEEQVALERGVVLEEIDMYEDTPDELVSEQLFSSIYASSPLGMPILGTPETLVSFDGSGLRDYMSRHYVGSSTVAAVSGSFTDDDIKRLCSYLELLPNVGAPEIAPAAYSPAFVTKSKQIEQNHICLGFEGLALNDEARYKLQLFNQVLGGGMSSRLFQKVREENGLCYSVYTYSAAHEGTGVAGVYTALGSDTQKKALSLIFEEIKKLVEGDLTEKELSRAREQIRASVLMGLESSVTRMNHMARSELLLNKVPDPNDVIAKYEACTLSDVLSTAADVYRSSRLSFSLVGDTENVDWFYETKNNFTFGNNHDNGAAVGQRGGQ